MAFTTDNMNPSRCQVTSCGKQDSNRREVTIQIPGDLQIRVTLCEEHAEKYGAAFRASRAAPPPTQS